MPPNNDLSDDKECVLPKHHLDKSTDNDKPYGSDGIDRMTRKSDTAREQISGVPQAKTRKSLKQLGDERQHIGGDIGSMRPDDFSPTLQQHLDKLRGRFEAEADEDKSMPDDLNEEAVSRGTPEPLQADSGTPIDAMAGGFWNHLRCLGEEELTLTQVQQRALERVEADAWSPFTDGPSPRKRPSPASQASQAHTPPAIRLPGQYVWRMFVTMNKEQEIAIVHRVRQALLLLAWGRFLREVPEWEKKVLKGGGCVFPLQHSKKLDDLPFKPDTRWETIYSDVVPRSMCALPSVEVAAASPPLYIPRERFEKLGLSLDRDAQNMRFLASEFGEEGVLLLAVVTPLAQMLEHGNGLGADRVDGIAHGHAIGINRRACEYGLKEVTRSLVGGLFERLKEGIVGEDGKVET